MSGRAPSDPGPDDHPDVDADADSPPIERTALIAPYPLDRALPELASRQQLSAALNEGVLVKDADDRNVWFNAAACRLLARTPDEMLGPSNNRDSWSIHGPDLTHLPDARWPFQVARETCRPVAGVLVRGDDGHGRPIWLAKSATPTRRGDEAATIVVFRDVTPEIEHRLQLERTLVEINRTLVQEHLPRPALVDFAARIHTSGESRTTAATSSASTRSNRDSRRSTSATCAVMTSSPPA